MDKNISSYKNFGRCLPRAAFYWMCMKRTSSSKTSLNSIFPYLDASSISPSGTGSFRSLSRLRLFFGGVVCSFGWNSELGYHGQSEADPPILGLLKAPLPCHHPYAMKVLLFDSSVCWKLCLARPDSQPSETLQEPICGDLYHRFPQLSS